MNGNRKQPKLSIDERINCGITINGLLAIKRNDVVIQATIWMNLKNILRSSYKRPHIVRFRLYEMPKTGKKRQKTN